VGKNNKAKPPAKAAARPSPNIAVGRKMDKFWVILFAATIV
jgi:hypothetical protein